jgi:predicted PurR-regulated permease PerM
MLVNWRKDNLGAKVDTDIESRPAKLLIYSAAAVILTIGMREIGGILIPIFFSIFAFLIFSPLIHWLQRKGVPGPISIALVILFFIIIAIGAVILVTASLFQLSTQIPGYQTQFSAILQNIDQYLPSSGQFSLEEILRDVGAFLLGLTAGILTGVLNAGTTTTLIIITTAFLLLDATGAPKKVQKGVQDQPMLLMRVTEFGNSLVHYILIRTEINLIAGIGTTILLLIGGIDFAILWGILTFLLGYIPFLGFYLAVFPPVALAFFKYGALGALAIFVGIGLINQLVENILFPSLAGKGLKLSASIVFLSLFYWAFVLGTPGSLIAVPLTMVVKMIFESSDETRWLAKLMESKGKEDKKEEKESPQAS